LLSILGPHINKKSGKKRINIKKYWKKIKKIYSSEKSIPEHTKTCWRLVEEDKIYKTEIFDSVFFTDKGPISKENLIWGGKFKIEYLKTQLEFFKIYLNLLRAWKWLPHGCNFFWVLGNVLRFPGKNIALDHWFRSISLHIILPYTWLNNNLVFICINNTI
jgi:hypothetical protein